MISDYASLQTAIQNWLNKSGDANLTARIPEFIQLAEARLQRKIDDNSQHATATLTFANGTATLPVDFEHLVEFDGDDISESAVIYDIIGTDIQTSPAITGDVSIVYTKSLPALSDANTTNWLLTRAPDIYLYASLLQAEFYGWNDERLPLIKTALDEALQELNVDGEQRRWGPSISPIIRRT